jgi:hypothetical protein
MESVTIYGGPRILGESHSISHLELVNQALIKHTVLDCVIHGSGLGQYSPNKRHSIIARGNAGNFLIVNFGQGLDNSVTLVGSVVVTLQDKVMHRISAPYDLYPEYCGHSAGSMSIRTRSHSSSRRG